MRDKNMMKYKPEDTNMAKCHRTTYKDRKLNNMSKQQGSLTMELLVFISLLSISSPVLVSAIRNSHSLTAAMRTRYEHLAQIDNLANNISGNISGTSSSKNGSNQELPEPECHSIANYSNLQVMQCSPHTASELNGHSTYTLIKPIQ